MVNPDVIELKCPKCNNITFTQWGMKTTLTVFEKIMECVVCGKLITVGITKGGKKDNGLI